MLAFGFRGFSTSGSDALAGFLLGVLLLALGVAGLVVVGEQTILVDPKARRITVEDSNRFGTKKRAIPFDDVSQVSVRFVGKKSSFVTWYYLVLQLRSGEQYQLFAPGRSYDGESDRSTVESWCARLEEYLGGR